MKIRACICMLHDQAPTHLWGKKTSIESLLRKPTVCGIHTLVMTITVKSANMKLSDLSLITGRSWNDDGLQWPIIRCFTFHVGLHCLDLSNLRSPQIVSCKDIAFSYYFFFKSWSTGTWLPDTINQRLCTSAMMSLEARLSIMTRD